MMFTDKAAEYQNCETDGNIILDGMNLQTLFHVTQQSWHGLAVHLSTENNNTNTHSIYFTHSDFQTHCKLRWDSQKIWEFWSTFYRPHSFLLLNQQRQSTTSGRKTKLWHIHMYIFSTAIFMW